MQKQTCSWILVAVTGLELTARDIVKVLGALLHPEILCDHSPPTATPTRCCLKVMNQLGRSLQSILLHFFDTAKQVTGEEFTCYHPPRKIQGEQNVTAHVRDFFFF